MTHRVTGSFQPIHCENFAKPLCDCHYSVMAGRAMTEIRLTTGSFAADRAGRPSGKSESPFEPFSHPTTVARAPGIYLSAAQRAQYAEVAAHGGLGHATVQPGGDGIQLLACNRLRPPACAATPFGSSQTSNDPLLDQGTFVLCQCAEHMDQQLTQMP